MIGIAISDPRAIIVDRARGVRYTITHRGAEP